MVNHKTADLVGSLEGKQNSALTAEDLFGEILVLEKTLARLKEKILSVLPAKYGSDAWWERSDKEAIKSIEQGRGVKFDNLKEAIKYLTG